MKKAYCKPSAQLYCINANGFIASGGGGCYQHVEAFKHYDSILDGFYYMSTEKRFNTVPSADDFGACWNWVNSNSF